MWPGQEVKPLWLLSSGKALEQLTSPSGDGHQPGGLMGPTLTEIMVVVSIRHASNAPNNGSGLSGKLGYWCGSLAWEDKHDVQTIKIRLTDIDVTQKDSMNTGVTEKRGSGKRLPHSIDHLSPETFGINHRASIIICS